MTKFDPTELDAALMAPLADVPDAGFSVRVLMQIEERQAVRRAVVGAGAAAVAAVGMAMLPWQEVVSKSLHDLAPLLLQPNLYIAALAVTVFVLFDKQLVRF